MRAKHLLAGLVAAATVAVIVPSASATDVYRVGFIDSLSGPVSSSGVPYDRALKAGFSQRHEVHGRTIELIPLDDKSDPTTATLNARRLISVNHVDAIIGAAGTPESTAIAAVAKEMKVPQIASAYVAATSESEWPWTVAVPQPVSLMVDAVVRRMKRDGVKTIGYIGFSDAWGDLVYKELEASAGREGMKVVANERYARSDSSVTGQVLKVIASKPDAVITGVAGTPGALPYITLAKYGYKGGIYGTHALLQSEFIKVAGSAANGLIVPAGPYVVAEQLPADNPIRAVSLEYAKIYQKVNGQPADNAFGTYAYDAWRIFLNAAERVPASVAPGTPEFRTALNDAIHATTDLVGTQAVYNFKPDRLFGVDARAVVIVRLENGHWKLAK